MKNQKLRIILDIDDVIFDWHRDYAKKFNCDIPTEWDNSESMKNRLNSLTKDKHFWLNLTLKNTPNFIPKAFVSARGIPKAWTKESLKKANIPGRSSVYQVKWGESKISKLKSLNCNIFIDDKLETFLECNKNGIFCLLMDASHNQSFATDLRINDLKYENILEKYNQYSKKNNEK